MPKSMSRTAFLPLLLAGAVFTGGAASVPAQAEPRPATTAAKGTPASAGPNLPAKGKSTRRQTLQRARTWLKADNGRQVPYSQKKVWKDGYRQDCSGYASMALGLPKPGPNTVGLATNSRLTRQIPMSRLKPGDLVIDHIGGSTTRHVVVFEKWNNTARTSYTAYEQRGGHGTDHRTLTYGLKAGSQYKAYRPTQYGD
jgi:hypothetical protein